MLDDQTKLWVRGKSMNKTLKRAVEPARLFSNCIWLFKNVLSQSKPEKKLDQGTAETVAAKFCLEWVVSQLKKTWKRLLPS